MLGSVFSPCTVLNLECAKQAGKALLKTDYVEESSVEDCLKLAVKVLNKTMDSTTPSPEKMEFTTITRVNGKVGTILSSIIVRIKSLFFSNVEDHSNGIVIFAVGCDVDYPFVFYFEL